MKGIYTMEITVLAENTTECNMPVEHGLSLYIEVCGKKILFDMGETELFSENAKKLGKDIGEVDTAIVSHGHYDHGGGLEKFLQINSKAKVYISRYAFEPHYNASGKYIGLKEELEKSSRLIFTNGVTNIDKGITLYDCNDMKKICVTEPFGLKAVHNGKITDDDFRHEQYLLIEKDGKKVLISGCSHKGIINIAEWFKPDVLVGGFHFFKLDAVDTLRAFALKLNSYNTEYYTCHCTGVEQYKFMKNYITKLSYISTGKSIVI